VYNKDVHPELEYHLYTALGLSPFDPPVGVNVFVVPGQVLLLVTEIPVGADDKLYRVIGKFADIAPTLSQLFLPLTVRLPDVALLAKEMVMFVDVPLIVAPEPL
jgi:hypothetical protein